MDAEYHQLLRLSRNPHYRLSEKQKQKLREFDNDPVVLFGIVPTHQNTFETHKTQVKKLPK